MNPGAPQHTVVPVYAQPDELAWVFVCERCGQPLTGPHDLCDNPRHKGTDRTGVGRAVRSTELAQLAGAARAALGGAR